MANLPRGFAGFCLLFVLPASPTVARAADWPPIAPEDLRMTSLAEQPGAPAVVLLRDELTDDKRNFQSTYIRIKVLTEAGREHADVEIPYSRRHVTIGDVSGRTIHADGSIVPFDGKVFDKILLRTRGRGREERYHVKSFTLPDVQVGSILEYRYVRRYGDQTVYPPEWAVQSDLFQKKVTFKFIPYPGLVKLAHDQIGQRVAWTSFLPPGANPQLHHMPGLQEVSDFVDLAMTNVPALVPEPYTLPPSAVRYRVNFYYMTINKNELFWRDEGRFWSKDVETFVGKNEGVAQALSKATSAGDSAEDKVKKVYAFVSHLDNWSYNAAREEQEERALGIKPNEGAADVLRQHGGQHDDLTRLFVSMVRAAGLPASVMWVSSRDREVFDPAWLSTSQLAAEVAIVPLAGKDVFLDPGTKFCPFGLMDWRYTNARGLRQSGNKGAELAESGLLSSNQALIQRVARLTLLPDGKVEGVIRVGFSGLEAMRLRQEGGKTDAEGKKKLLENEVKRWLPADSEVTLTRGPAWENAEAQLATEFKASATLAVSAGKRWIVPVHLFQVNDKPVFPSSDRVHSVYFDYMWREIDEVHVTLPPGLEVESLPANESVSLDFAGYTTTQKQESASSVMAVRDVVMAGLVFPTTVYKDVKGFFDKVKAGDDQPLLARAAAPADGQ